MEPKRIFHLNLKKKWYEMIKSGKKKHEYRDISEYWKKRFIKFKDGQFEIYEVRIGGVLYDPGQVVICFSNGYAKNRDYFFIELIDIRKSKGRKAWGAKRGKKYFKLELGKIYNQTYLKF